MIQHSAIILLLKGFGTPHSISDRLARFKKGLITFGEGDQNPT